MNELEREQNRQDREYRKTKSVLVANIREAIKNPGTKKLIWEILSMSSMYQTTFTGNSQGAYLEGRRSIGLDILALIEEADSKFYPNLLLEHQKDTI